MRLEDKMELTHFNDEGRARMVDVSEKAPTMRRALARGEVHMAPATAEAIMMAVAAGKKQNKVLASETLDPKTLAVVKTYAHFHGIELEMIPAENGVTSLNDLQDRLSQHPREYAAVLVQQPNFFGIVEDYSGFAEAIHAEKGLFIMNCVAADLAVLKTPAEWGADIAVGDGQSLGIPMQWGGPYVGYMCCTEKLIRKMPGRIVGKTLDNRGQRAFVLTLQAREQHIRRQKATSRRALLCRSPLPLRPAHGYGPLPTRLSR